MTVQNGPLPKGWREVRLGEFMEFKNGLNTRKENYGSGVKFVNVMDVFGHNRLYANDVIGSVQVTKKQLVDYSVKYGDVLFNRTSETFEEIAMSSVYLDKKEIIFGGFVIRGRQTSNILLPEYSAYCFQAHTVRRELIRRGQGAVRANIGQKDLSKIPLVIPPVNEQKAIASLLEKWDTAIEKTEALIEAKEKRFKWLLKTLISDQQDNPAWRQVKLGEICKVFKGQGLSKNSIRENGKNKCILYGQLYTIYPEIIDKVISKTDINKGIPSKIGDLLIPSSTTTKGIDLANATALFEENVLLGGDINILRVLKENVYDSSFLAYQLTHSKKREIARYTQGITIVHLYGKDLRNLTLSLPDIKKQRRIVKTLNTAQKEITLLNQLAEQYRTQKRELMQKLLTGKWRVSNK